ncbi:MAG: dihydroorotate dehydrogenase [Thermogutta sp.]|nr:dihydroorotate dehydrogenase [Thermogutta sp.]
MDLSVTIGGATFPNPIMAASGTFGYAREMENVLDLKRLGAIVPKTITLHRRKGNLPPRTAETPAGLLNSIGLDNDGVDAFLADHIPYLAEIGVPIVVSIAGKTVEEFAELARRLDGRAGVTALELNVSCPNVSGGVDFGADAGMCRRVVRAVRGKTGLPIFVKLTPNVTDIVSIGLAAEDAGADALTAINTCLGMAVDWRRRVPRLGNVVGGLSGPAIKPVALRAVYQLKGAVSIPVIGVGGIATVDDCMEFFVVGASAVQVGTASFYRPTAVIDILERLPEAVRTLGAETLSGIVGTIRIPAGLRESRGSRVAADMSRWRKRREDG